MKKYLFLSNLLLSVFFASCDEVNQDQDPDDFDSSDTLSQINATKETLTKSVLTIYDIKKNNSWVAFETEMHLEAPNWTPDGKYITFNSNGKIYRIQLYTDALPEEIPTGFATNCTSGHLISFDGSTLAFSHKDQEINTTKIYSVPMAGGTPKLITPTGPSNLHGWSPDGKKIVYAGKRNGDWNIYTIDVTGKNEIQLTDTKGIDDGPEFSPDGKYIYFNSERSGTMQLWRMDFNGKNQIQITNSNTNDWYPHVSPDNSKMVYLAYDSTVTGHALNKNIDLFLMNTIDYQSKSMVKLFGGQGTMNVNSWSPDSRKIAFISYEPLK